MMYQIMRNKKTGLVFSCLMILCMQTVHAMTVEELRSKLNNNAEITLIDVRINAQYQRSHIPNAINIPASIIEVKKLPALGSVVVYGDGIDNQVVEQAVGHLNAKPGIVAEALEGGFSTWTASSTTVNARSGLDIKRTRNITYQKLQQMTESDRSLILLDIRQGSEQESLAAHFPGIQVYDPIGMARGDIDNPATTGAILADIPRGNRNVLILIDDANGFSEIVADKLHAAGVTRLAILTGGEHALRAKGISTQESHRSGDGE